jgi:probable blue pigment (indigoidine) exporter
MKHLDLKTTLLTALVPLFFGSTYAVTVLALPPGRPLFTAAVRALPAGLLLLLAVPRRPQGIWWVRLAILGSLNIAAVFALVFVAAYRMPGGLAAVISGIQPLVVALLATAVLGERLRMRGLVAALVGMFGIALLVIRGGAALDPIGLLAAAGAPICGGIGIILARRWGRSMPMLPFVGWQLVFGGLLLSVLAVLFEGAPPHLTGTNIAALLYLGGCSTLLAYVLWFRGIERLGPAPASMLSLLNPIAAAFLGVGLLGERYTATQLLGAAIVLGALIVGFKSAAETGRTPRTLGAES